MKKIIFFCSISFLCTLCILLFTFNSFSQPVTFNYTGSVQTYTVGTCVYSLNVDIKGAEGSVAAATSPGGKGGRVQATIPVTPGEVLNIYVGQKPLSSMGGWNGGGSGGNDGGGGGGSSDIRQGGINLSDRIIVAGGGGGGGFYQSNTYYGGVGGGLIGGNGFGVNVNITGKGGTQTSGGAGGIDNFSGTPGSLGIGGNGGGTSGGGGGAGYYGGGGGGHQTWTGGGGGGGSSYTFPSASGVTHTQAFQTGDGQIIITPAPQGPSAPGNIAGSNSVCAGTAASYSISPVPAATTYTWTVPSGAVINSAQGTTSITVTFGSASGNISVAAGNSCGNSPATTKTVTVNPSPTPNAGGDVSICTGSSVILSASGGTNYSWSTGETTVSITVSPSSSATYTVVASNAGGCTGTDEVTVTVDSCVTGISSISGNINIIISPNPTAGKFYLSLSPSPPDSYRDRERRSKVEIYNVMGEQIQNLATGNMQLENNNMTFIDISSHPPGIYFVKVIPVTAGIENEYSFHKIIKQ